MALTVQEGERQRIARELHDEVGQTLTAMLLQIESFFADAPDSLRDELDELRETARSGAEDVRRIAQRLRPEALEELGLPSALLALTDLFARQTGLRVERTVEQDLPLTAQDELVIYRVAQEALTNIARHAHATTAELTLSRADDDAVLLVVRDDGVGFDVIVGVVLRHPWHARAGDAHWRDDARHVQPPKRDRGGGESAAARSTTARESKTAGHTQWKHVSRPQPMYGTSSRDLVRTDVRVRTAWRHPQSREGPATGRSSSGSARRSRSPRRERHSSPRGLRKG